jgi:hypothetical protein
MRRRGPEPPWAGPDVEFKPGMARSVLRELAPLLAEKGIKCSREPCGATSSVSGTGLSRWKP